MSKCPCAKPLRLPPVVAVSWSITWTSCPVLLTPAASPHASASNSDHTKGKLPTVMPLTQWTFGCAAMLAIQLCPPTVAVAPGELSEKWPPIASLV
eukprot:1186556-Prymnesium_polylepis.2